MLTRVSVTRSPFLATIPNQSPVGPTPSIPVAIRLGGVGIETIVPVQNVTGPGVVDDSQPAGTVADLIVVHGDLAHLLRPEISGAPVVLKSDDAAVVSEDVILVRNHIHRIGVGDSSHVAALGIVTTAVPPMAARTEPREGFRIRDCRPHRSLEDLVDVVETSSPHWSVIVMTTPAPGFPTSLIGHDSPAGA